MTDLQRAYWRWRIAVSADRLADARKTLSQLKAQKS